MISKHEFIIMIELKTGLQLKADMYYTESVKITFPHLLKNF
jgi:hypothetical protein